MVAWHCGAAVCRRPRTARRAMLRYANSIVLRERIARYHLRRRLRPHYHNNARVTTAVDTTLIP